MYQLELEEELEEAPPIPEDSATIGLAVQVTLLEYEIILGLINLVSPNHKGFEGVHGVG